MKIILDNLSDFQAYLHFTSLQIHIKTTKDLIKEKKKKVQFCISERKKKKGKIQQIRVTLTAV